MGFDMGSNKSAEDKPGSVLELEQGSASYDAKVPQGEVVIGTISGLSEKGYPLVNFSISGRTIVSVEATTTLSFTTREIGRQAALLFIESKIDKPVVIGLIHSPLDMLLESYQETGIDLEVARDGDKHDNAREETDEPPHAFEDITIDGKKVHIEAQEEIVFKCGESSITMTRAGKITIRGKYILNRSSGVNRILGGSVQVN